MLDCVQVVFFYFHCFFYFILFFLIIIIELSEREKNTAKKGEALDREMGKCVWLLAMVTL